jgi:GR25 family glycosyltransferase involved in LPS biosynthesis
MKPDIKFKIIRLKNNSISEKYAAECIIQAAKFGITVEYFDAINGLNYQQHLDELKIVPKYKFKKGRAGVYGCFLSHYYLWKQCVQDNIPYGIMEHDGFFISKLPNDILNHFTDVLKLDGLDPYSKYYQIELEKEKDLSLTYKKYYNPSAKFLHKNETGNYMKGAYGYIIKPHAANRIIDWIFKNGFVPADQQIGDALVDIQVTSPSLIRLHPAYFSQIKELSLTGNPELL